MNRRSFLTGVAATALVGPAIAKSAMTESLAGYTGELPASLVTDVASVDTALVGDFWSKSFTLVYRLHNESDHDLHTRLKAMTAPWILVGSNIVIGNGKETNL